MNEDPEKKPTRMTEHLQTFVLVIVVTVGGLLALRYFGLR